MNTLNLNPSALNITRSGCNDAAVVGNAPLLSVVVEGTTILDACYSQMFEGRIGDGMTDLIAGLNLLRSQNSAVPDDWRYFAEVTCRNHPIAEILRHDPLSRLGQRVSLHADNLPSRESLRGRPTLGGKRIDEVAANCPRGARVLVIGAGAFSESKLSRAIQEGYLEQLVVVDGDVDHLKRISADLGDGVTTVHASTQAILARTVEFRDFDLVYVPTLFDSLTDAEAKRLTEVTFTMLAPGGRLLIANFSADTSDAGYRETFLGWKFLGRSEAALVGLSSGVPSRYVAQVRLYCDELAVTNFIELFRYA